MYNRSFNVKYLIASKPASPVLHIKKPFSSPKQSKHVTQFSIKHRVELWRVLVSNLLPLERPFTPSPLWWILLEVRWRTNESRMNLCVSCFKLNLTTSVQHHAGHQEETPTNPQQRTRHRGENCFKICLLHVCSLSYKMTNLWNAALSLAFGDKVLQSVSCRTRLLFSSNGAECDFKQNIKGWVFQTQTHRNWVYYELTYVGGSVEADGCKT